MDLSKNEPVDNGQMPEHAPQQTQNGYLTPPPPHAPHGYQNYPATPYNATQGQQGYPSVPPQNTGWAQPNPYGQQYGQAPYPGYYPPAIQPGAKEAKQSWILGLIGIFIFGLILGTLGLVSAFKARKLGADATAGFILSSLAIVFHILWIIVMIATGDSGSR